MLFEQGYFNPQSTGNERAAEVLNTAADRASAKVRPSDLVDAAIACGDARVLAMISQALTPGATPNDLRQLIEIYNHARRSPTDFDGSRERFSDEALLGLDEFDAEFQKGAERIRDASLMLLMACVFNHLDEDDREYLTILDDAQAAGKFREQVRIIIDPLTPLFDSASNRLRSDEFAEGAWTMLEHAAVRAADLGYDRVLSPHCFLALLGETEGVAEHLVRLQAQPEVGPGKVAEAVADAFRLSDRKTTPLELTRDSIGEATVVLLRAAQLTARLWGAEQVDTHHLLSALLDDMPMRLADVLQRSPINIDLAKMREHMDQYLRESCAHAKREIAFRLPPGLLPSEDLTYRARTEGFPEALHMEAYFDVMERALYRRTNNHIVVTGLRGVGKTALVWELARRAASEAIALAIPFLKRKRFLWVDCRDLGPEQSKEKLAAVLSHAGGRTDLVLCLDGLGPLLRAESGGNNKLALRAALKEGRVQMIGVMSDADFNDLLSAEPDILEFFTRVAVKEPDIEATFDIAKQACVALARDYKVTIEERVVYRALVLSSNFILNERFPAKAIKILRRVCEDIDYERTQLAKNRDTVTEEDLIDVVAEITGIPKETVSGSAKNDDYAKNLSEFVIGQDEALKAVATELKLIKAGLNDPGKPASVMMFAGLTGVGKTELAKALAKFYSSSKEHKTYTMGNFLEPHSISNIIGVPPGYVGHEQGGRIINDLNSDPYCVLLLDEADKPHPDIWKPFLNLFDEGWIVDQRGVKAFADRAIIILTSNAGQQVISDMSKAGKTHDEIIKAVKEALPNTVNDHGQKVFSPEFLARIKRIIIFKPLDEAAMEGICKKMLRRMQASWKEKREKTLIVPDALIKHIAHQSHVENERSDGKEGGRIVSKLMSELIDAAIQQEAGERESEYKACDTIKLIFLPPEKTEAFVPGRPAKVAVSFAKQEPSPPSECVAQALALLKQEVGATDGPNALRAAAANSLARVEEGLKRWAGRTPETNGVPEDLLERFRDACSQLEAQARESEHDARAIVERLIADLGTARGGAAQ